MVCKDADSMGEADALTLIAILLMPLILQQQQLVYCCESCMCLVCVNDVCLKLFSQILPVLGVWLWHVCTTCAEHSVHDLIFIIGLPACLPVPLPLSHHCLHLCFQGHCAEDLTQSCGVGACGPVPCGVRSLVGSPGAFVPYHHNIWWWKLMMAGLVRCYIMHWQLWMW